MDTKIAEQRNTLCQPHRSVKAPLNKREPKIPHRMPLNTIPTFLPRFSLPKAADIGRIICAGVEQTPIIKLRTSNNVKLVVFASIRSITIRVRQMLKISFLRFNLSPKGSKKNIPNP
ncbi:hypothetical protein D3C87_1570760 [compost metagenome]